MQVVDEFLEVMSIWWLTSPWACLSQKKAGSVTPYPMDSFPPITPKSVIYHIYKILVMRSFSHKYSAIVTCADRQINVLLGMLLTAGKEWQHVA